MNYIRMAAAIALSAMLVACGGGGGSAGTSSFGSGSGSDSGNGSGSGTTVGTPAIGLAISSATVTASTPATVTATVTDAKGNALPGQVVTFATAGSLGTFSVTSALTDASGNAVVALYPAAGATSGADQVVATSTVNGAALTKSIGFQLTATNVAISSFTADVGSGKLSPYGQTNLTVNVSGAAAGTPVTVTLGSVCVSKAKATLTPASVTTTNGVASFTYKDQGCGATDASDPLQAALVGTAASANLSLGLTSPAASSITFVSSTPDTIYLKGSGFVESSTVTFQVKDVAGNPLPGQSVTLVPTTQAGGLTLDGGSASGPKLSDSNGNVTALINSGTVPTPVRVQATLATGSISTVSSTLAIAVGLPSEINFSLSQETKNIEGMDIDGTPNAYKIIASDRLGNPVPAGTAINFVATGGQVEAIKQIQMVDGLARATANAVSASPRPSDGRITVLAYALGEESFVDQNGNNVYDCGEPFQDLGDMYLNRSFSGTYAPAVDQFISLSLSNSTACTQPVSNPGSTLLALDPSIPSIAVANPNGAKGPDAIWGRAYVRRATQTVFSTSDARPVWAANSGLNAACEKVDPPLINSNTGTTQDYYLVGPGGLSGLGAEGVFSFLVADANPVRLNPMAAGTAIAVSTTTEGLTVSVAGGSPIPSTLSVLPVAISYKFDVAKATSGLVTLKFTSPSGLVTSIPLSIQAGAAATTCP
jgi:hypothetical protein